MTGFLLCRSRGTLVGSAFTGSRWDKSASDAASTSVEGLRQPGGDHATFNQDVPGGVQVPIVGHATLGAGPGPDRQGLLPWVDPTRRAEPARGGPATDPHHRLVATQRLLLPTTGPVSTSRRRPPTCPAGSGPVRTRPGPARRSLGCRERCGGPACDVRPGGYRGPCGAGQRPGAPPWRA